MNYKITIKVQDNYTNEVYFKSESMLFETAFQELGTAEKIIKKKEESIEPGFHCEDCGLCDRTCDNCEICGTAPREKYKID